MADFDYEIQLHENSSQIKTDVSDMCKGVRNGEEQGGLCGG
jgi:hypothetical protein